MQNAKNPMKQDLTESFKASVLRSHLFFLENNIFFKLKGCALLNLSIYSQDMVSLQIQRADLALYRDTEKEKKTALELKFSAVKALIRRKCKAMRTHISRSINPSKVKCLGCEDTN